MGSEVRSPRPVVGSRPWGSSLARLLVSPRLAALILGLILLATAAGTFIVQGLESAAFAARYGLAAPFLQALGLDDIFHGRFFNGLLVLLAVCLLLVAWSKRPWRPKQAGFLAAHLGVVLVLAGGLLGNLLGFKGWMDLHEGERSARAWPRPGFGDPRRPLDLGFAIGLEDFQIEYHPQRPGQYGPPQAKAFRSRLAVLEEGHPVLAKTIAVNDPLEYDGYHFYQANYRWDDPTYSGLEVVRDPGLPLVWTGFFLIGGGVIFLFYVKPRLSHRMRFRSETSGPEVSERSERTPIDGPWAGGAGPWA